MTVQHVYSQTVADGTATSVVRPSDWNSFHNQAVTLAGNTAGVASVSGTNIVFAGGSNVTLSASQGASAATISISGATAAPSPMGFSAGTTSGDIASVVFSNSNGVSFGLDGSTVTASVRTDYQSAGAYLTTAMQSNAATLSNIRVSGGTTSNLLSAVTFADSNGVSFGLNAGTLTGTVKTDYALSNHSHGNPTLALTNLSGTTASNSAGLTLSLSAAAGGGGADGYNILAAGTQTAATTGTVLFSNLNGITFGMSSSSVITASHNGLTQQTTQPVAASGQNGSFAFSTLSFSNANGISFGTSAGSAITASYSVPTVTNSSWTVSDNASSATVGRLAFTNLNGVTLSLSTGAGGSHTIVGSHNALTSQSNQNVTAANGGFAFQTLSFSNINGISFGTSAGSAITASHNALTTARASTDAIGLNTAQSNVTWTANSAGLSLDARGYAGTGTTFAGANISGSMTVNSVGVNLSMSVAAPGGGGETRGSFYAVSNTTQSTSGTIALSSLRFAGAGIASVGISNGSVVVSVPAGGGAGDGGIFGGVSNLGNTAGSTGTVSTGNIVFVGSNGVTLSQSTGAVGSHATITVFGEGRTNSMMVVAPFAGMEGVLVPVSTGGIYSLAQNTLQLYPFKIRNHLSVDHIKMMASITNLSSAAASVQRGYTYRVGIFTRVDATKISQLYSTSYTIAASHNSNASWMLSMITAIGNSTSYNTLTASSAGINLSSSLHGAREMIMPFSTVMTPGVYWIAIAASSSSAGAGGNVILMSHHGHAYTTQNRLGAVTATSNRAVLNDWGMGVYTATTGDIPASIAFSEINLGAAAPVFFLGTGTV